MIKQKNITVRNLAKANLEILSEILRTEDKKVLAIIFECVNVGNEISKDDLLRFADANELNRTLRDMSLGYSLVCELRPDTLLLNPDIVACKLTKHERRMRKQQFSLLWEADEWQAFLGGKRESLFDLDIDK